MKAYLLTLVLAALCCCRPVANAQQTPKLIITNVPAVGKGNAVSGEVILDAKKQNYADYRVTMALQVQRDGHIWGPKPYKDEPAVSVSRSGSFVCNFVSGGSDHLAETLYVYLIPRGFVPTENIDRTEKAAIDKVIINRAKNGRPEIQYTRPESTDDKKD
jgi:hypothetical protein